MKKFNFKLTIALVSLFVSVILLVFANMAKECIGFACFFMAVSCITFALNRKEKIDTTIRLTNEDLENEEDDEVVYQVQLEKKKYLKSARRIQFSLYLCAVLLVIVGIFALI